eukprot:2556617-Lingulodinium_polyedra.AAC.1
MHGPEDDLSSGEGAVEVDATRVTCGITDAAIIRDNRFPPLRFQYCTRCLVRHRRLSSRRRSMSEK